eukprot:gene5608-6298_t
MAMAGRFLNCVAFFVVFAICLRFSTSYKPVILVHGVLSDGEAMHQLKSFIQEANPGTIVTSLDIYDHLSSFVPLNTQMPLFIAKVKAIMDAHKDGVHLICHSQGGLVCRGIIERVPDHSIHTFITLSAPLMGQFGVPPSWTKLFPFLNNKTRDELTKIMYHTFTQDVLSVANYWRDPRPEHFKTYEKVCKFLPLLENNPEAANYVKNVAAAQKKNFLKVAQMVAIGGPDDGVIDPWYSSIYGYLAPDCKSPVPMLKQKAYTEDWFGLRSLDERGNLAVYEFSGVKHKLWHSNKTVFDNAMKKCGLKREERNDPGKSFDGSALNELVENLH